MFAFVGYIVHANGIKFPWAMQMDGTPFPDANGNPPALWDAVSDDAKWQIFGLIAFLEFWSELSTPNHKVRYCEELSLFYCHKLYIHSHISITIFSYCFFSRQSITWLEENPVTSLTSPLAPTAFLTQFPSISMTHSSFPRT